MGATGLGEDTATRSAVEEADPDQVRFDHSLNRTDRVTGDRGEWGKANRPTGIAFGERREDPAVGIIEAARIESEPSHRPLGDGDGCDGDPLEGYLITKAPQEPVGDPWHAATPGGEVVDRCIVDRQVELAGRADEDGGDLFVTIPVEAEDRPKPVTQGSRNPVDVGCGTDQGERGDRQREGRGLWTSADDDIDPEVLHGSVEDLLNSRTKSVDLIEEEDVTAFEIGEDGDEVASPLKRRSGGGPETRPGRGSNDPGERGLAEPRWAVEEEVFDRFAPSGRPGKHRAQGADDVRLTDILLERGRAEGAIERGITLGERGVELDGAGWHEREGGSESGSVNGLVACFALTSPHIRRRSEDCGLPHSLKGLPMHRLTILLTALLLLAFGCGGANTTLTTAAAADWVRAPGGQVYVIEDRGTTAAIRTFVEGSLRNGDVLETKNGSTAVAVAAVGNDLILAVHTENGTAGELYRVTADGKAAAITAALSEDQRALFAALQEGLAADPTLAAVLPAGTTYGGGQVLPAGDPSFSLSIGGSMIVSVRSEVATTSNTVRFYPGVYLLTEALEIKPLLTNDMFSIETQADSSFSYSAFVNDTHMVVNAMIGHDGGEALALSQTALFDAAGTPASGVEAYGNPPPGVYSYGPEGVEASVPVRGFFMNDASEDFAGMTLRLSYLMCDFEASEMWSKRCGSEKGSVLTTGDGFQDGRYVGMNPAGFQGENGSVLQDMVRDPKGGSDFVLAISESPIGKGVFLVFSDGYAESAVPLSGVDRVVLLPTVSSLYLLNENYDSALYSLAYIDRSVATSEPQALSGEVPAFLDTEEGNDPPAYLYAFGDSLYVLAKNFLAVRAGSASLIEGQGGYQSERPNGGRNIVIFGGMLWSGTLSDDGTSYRYDLIDTLATK